MKRKGGFESAWTWEAAEDYYYAAGSDQRPICKHFGCGKPLRPTEQLYGDYCFKHSKIITMSKENLYEPDCIRTVSGKCVNVFEPDPETICIEDIAHALAHQPRFGGHLPQLYTVAQHSLFCAELAEDPYKFTLLMHDTSEGYLLDIPRPIKLRLANYKEIEDNLMTVIAAKFGFQYPFDPYVKRIDEAMLQLEWTTLMLERGDSFEVYSPQKAKLFFLKKFQELK